MSPGTGSVGLAQAHQVVAHDPTGVFQTLVRPDRHLSRQAVPVREHGRADQGRELGIDEDLSADNHEGAVLLGIASRLVYAIDFNALPSASPYA